MDRSFFVAYKIIGRTNFSKHIDNNGKIIGCQLNYNNFISRKVVILERSYDGQLFNVSDDYKPCATINPENLKSYSYDLNCSSCHMKILDDTVCKNVLESNLLDIPLGVIEVQPMHYFTNVDDLDLSFELIRKYNENIEDEYSLINLDNYIDTITYIYEGARKIKTRTFD